MKNLVILLIYTVNSIIRTKTGHECSFPFEQNGKIWRDSCDDLNSCYVEENREFEKCLTTEQSIDQLLTVTVTSYEAVFLNFKKEIKNDANSPTSKDIVNVFAEKCPQFSQDCLRSYLFNPLVSEISEKLFLEKVMNRLKTMKNQFKEIKERENEKAYEESKVKYFKPDVKFSDPLNQPINFKNINVFEFITIIAQLDGICIQQCKEALFQIFMDKFNKERIFLDLAAHLTEVQSIRDIPAVEKIIMKYKKCNNLIILKGFRAVEEWTFEYFLFLLHRYIFQNNSFEREILECELKEEVFIKFSKEPTLKMLSNSQLKILTSILPLPELSIPNILEAQIRLGTFNEIYLTNYNKLIGSHNEMIKLESELRGEIINSLRSADKMISNKMTQLNSKKMLEEEDAQQIFEINKSKEYTTNLIREGLREVYSNSEKISIIGIEHQNQIQYFIPLSTNFFTLENASSNSTTIQFVQRISKRGLIRLTTSGKVKFYLNEELVKETERKIEDDITEYTFQIQKSSRIKIEFSRGKLSYRMTSAYISRNYDKIVADKINLRLDCNVACAVIRGEKCFEDCSLPNKWTLDQLKCGIKNKNKEYFKLEKICGLSYSGYVSSEAAEILLNNDIALMPIGKGVQTFNNSAFILDSIDGFEGRSFIKTNTLLGKVQINLKSKTHISLLIEENEEFEVNSKFLLNSGWKISGNKIRLKLSSTTSIQLSEFYGIFFDDVNLDYKFLSDDSLNPTIGLIII